MDRVARCQPRGDARLVQLAGQQAAEISRRRTRLAAQAQLRPPLHRREIRQIPDHVRAGKMRAHRVERHAGDDRVGDGQVAVQGYGFRELAAHRLERLAEQRLQLNPRSLHRNARSQPPQHPNLARIRVGCQRHPQIRGRAAVQPEERWRHDADDGSGFRIHLDGAPDDGGGATEAALPVAVAEHRGLDAAGFLLGLREPVAKQRRHGESLQHPVADKTCLDLLRLGNTGDVRVADVPHAHGLQCFVVIGEGEVHGVG